MVRPARLAAFVVVLAALLAIAANRTWVEAQGRAAVVLAIMLKAPVLTTAVELVTDEPREADVVFAGVPTRIVRPGHEGPWPTIVFVNGVTRRGRHHPTVRRLARAFARAGFLVYVPDPPGLAAGELTPATLEATTAVARAAATRPDARDGSVSLFGVSAGGSLALLAAQDADLSGRVSIVVGIAPYTDLADVVRLATTGFHLERGRLIRYGAEPFVALVAARSLAAGLPPGPDRNAVLGEFRSLPDGADTPLAGVRSGRVRPPGAAGRALVALLANRDPRLFDAFFEALPPAVRASTRRLSPILGARRVGATVELISAPHDKYFPPAESRAFLEVAPDARLTISSTLEHADLTPSLGEIADLGRLDAFVVRALHAASEGS